MMRAMYSGVSGLRVHQSRMDVIGNNIANVNTVGFKSSRATFNEMFNQTIQGASAPNQNTGGTNPMQVGLGVNLASIDTIMTGGTAQRTDNTLDLKIARDGFFIVSDNTGNKFTRAGAFRLDKNGYLVNPEGLHVMGWKPNPNTGLIQKGQVEELSVFDPQNLIAEPESTKNITLVGNVNKEDPQLVSTGSGYIFSTDIYDSLGYKYKAEFSIKSDGSDSKDKDTEGFTIKLKSLYDRNGKDVIGEATGLGNPIFNVSNGKISDPSKATMEITNLDSISKSLPKSLTMDFSNLTMLAGTTDIDPLQGDINGFNGGKPAGEMSGFTISQDGTIHGKYTNGSTKILGQIAVAEFKNPTGLQKVGNNLFDVTPNSGNFDGIGQDVTDNGGAINSGTLEMSNVDLSKEFTEMITTQRGFQANSRIITASDEMLQELVNLKR